jgi:hypothetical protein
LDFRGSNLLYSDFTGVFEQFSAKQTSSQASPSPCVENRTPRPQIQVLSSLHLRLDSLK